MRAIGYTRVSTDKQDDSGLGQDAQRHSIELEIARRGWDLLDPLFDEVASGKSMRKRPLLAKALATLDAGDADVLVVAKLDRLARSVADFSGMLERARKNGWALDVVDMGVDTTTANGKMFAQVLMALAEWEREIIAERTRAGLAATRRSGTRLGRRANVDDDTLALIRTLRAGGRGYHAIAKILNDSRVATAQGGKQWYPATVKNVYERDQARGGVEDHHQLVTG